MQTITIFITSCDEIRYNENISNGKSTNGIKEQFLINLFTNNKTMFHSKENKNKFNSNKT